MSVMQIQSDSSSQFLADGNSVTALVEETV